MSECMVFNPEAQSGSVVGKLEQELGTQADNV